jgi:tetratricopeptide (TPR) repeat protein
VLKHCETCYNCECVAKALCKPCKAERHLQDALIADVRYGPAHNTLGTLYFSQHKLYLAAWEFEYAASLMPGRPEPFNNLGLVYEEAGRLGQAIESYEAAYAAAPSNAEYIGNLARALLKQGTPHDEVEHLLSELRMHDSRPDWLEWADDLLETHADGAKARTPAFGGDGAGPLTQPTLIEPETLPSPPEAPMDDDAAWDAASVREQ